MMFILFHLEENTHLKMTSFLCVLFFKYLTVFFLQLFDYSVNSYWRFKKKQQQHNFQRKKTD